MMKRVPYGNIYSVHLLPTTGKDLHKFWKKESNACSHSSFNVWHTMLQLLIMAKIGIYEDEHLRESQIIY